MDKGEHHEHEMMECCEEHMMSKEHLEHKKEWLEKKLKMIEEKLKTAK